MDAALEPGGTSVEPGEAPVEPVMGLKAQEPTDGAFGPPKGFKNVPD